MIQRLYVHNYRCLENFELPLAGRPSALLIGANGAGKSTVRAALEVLRQLARGANRVGDLLAAGDFAGARTDVPIRFELEAVLNGATYEYRLACELPPGFRELRVLDESLACDGEPVYSRELSQVNLANQGESRFGLDWHTIALPIIHERSNTEPVAVFRRWLASMLLLAPIPSAMTGDSDGETTQPDWHLTTFGNWWSGVIGQAPAAYSVVADYLRALLPDFAEVFNRATGQDAKRLFVRFRKDQSGLEVPFGALSDGEKSYFVAALVLAANQAYGPLVCFWDEPDSHLALSEVGQFVLAQRRACEARGQFLATSHDPETIRHFAAENTLLLFRRSHLEPTIVRPVSELQVHGNLVDALLRGDVEP